MNDSHKSLIRNLSESCVAAYKANPELWILNYEVSFDYPEYGGLSKKVSTCLGPDCVDAIQAFVYGVAKHCNKFSAENLEHHLTELDEGGYAIPN